MNRLMVKDIMSTDLVTLEENEDLDLADNAMKYGRIRHLPVLEDGALVGIVSIGDVLKAIISHQEVVIRDLEHYITGAPR